MGTAAPWKNPAAARHCVGCKSGEGKRFCYPVRTFSSFNITPRSFSRGTWVSSTRLAPGKFAGVTWGSFDSGAVSKPCSRQTPAFHCLLASQEQGETRVGNEKRFWETRVSSPSLAGSQGDAGPWETRRGDPAPSHPLPGSRMK